MELISELEGDNFDIDINKLAATMNITITSLMSILTELEQRDEIKIEINTTTDSEEQLQYSGKVRLMRTPPDEEGPLDTIK